MAISTVRLARSGTTFVLYSEIFLLVYNFTIPLQLFNIIWSSFPSFTVLQENCVDGAVEWMNERLENCDPLLIKNTKAILRQEIEITGEGAFLL